MVSSDGKVKSLFRYKKILKPNRMNNGYLGVELFKDKQSKRLLIHRLVAEAFIPNPHNLPCINRIDENKENKENNNVHNLEWCTHKYNSNYGNCQKKKVNSINYKNPIYKETAFRASMISRKPILQFTKSGLFLKRYESIKQASEALNINAARISEVAKEKRKSTGWYAWKFERSVDLSESQS